jgi:hypothetical protein
LLGFPKPTKLIKCPNAIPIDTQFIAEEHIFRRFTPNNRLVMFLMGRGD